MRETGPWVMPGATVTAIGQAGVHPTLFNGSHLVSHKRQRRDTQPIDYPYAPGAVFLFFVVLSSLVISTFPYCPCTRAMAERL